MKRTIFCILIDTVCVEFTLIGFLCAPPPRHQITSSAVEEELPVVVEGDVLEDGGEEEKTFTRPRFVQVKVHISSPNMVKISFPAAG